jgi:site-specific recombinase XerC
VNETELAHVDRFLDHLRYERRLSPHTVENYRRDLHGVALLCSECGVTAWTELTPALVRAYIAQRHRTGLGGRSLARALSALRGFYHSELVRLNLSDIDLADSTVRVTGKGNKMRVVPACIRTDCAIPSPAIS